jgi:hypothetical protein
MKAVLVLSVLLSGPAKMPSPADVLAELKNRDEAAALHFCAERPTPQVRRAEASASDIDVECENVITRLYPRALHLPMLRDLGPMYIRALEKSPFRWHLAKPYSERYWFQTTGVRRHSA